MGTKEQISRRWIRMGRGMSRWLKAQYAQWRRRQEKKDPENAPKKNPYRGYSD